MNTNKKGNIGLAKVISDLSVKGYSIFLPLTDTTNVDIIAADSEMKLLRIQVKFRKSKFGRIGISLDSIVNGKRTRINTDSIDLWAIYCPDTDGVYYFPKRELDLSKRTIMKEIGELTESGIVLPC